MGPQPNVAHCSPRPKVGKQVFHPIPSPGVCRGTSYFAPHVLKPSIALTITMDFSVGDKVFYTCSNGVCVLATLVGFALEGFVHLIIFKMQSRW